MKTMILFFAFFAECLCGETIQVWNLSEVILDLSNEELVGAAVEKKVFGVVVYSAAKEIKDIEVGDLFANLIKKKNESKRDGMNPFLGKSDYYAIKGKGESVYFIEIDRKKKGLCRVALMDARIWPIATVAESKATLFFPEITDVIIRLSRTANDGLKQ